MFKVYVAGPISNSNRTVELENIQKAQAFAGLIAGKGMAVYLPHFSYYVDTELSNTGNEPLGREWLEQDKEWLLLCDAVYRVQGESAGADQELKWANEAKISVFFVLDNLFSYAKQLPEKLNPLLECKHDPSTCDHSEEEIIIYETGAKEAKLNTRFDLVPQEGLLAVARVAAYGADKYGAHNWQKGIPSESMLNHAMNHVTLYLLGDTSEDHLPHAAWRLLAAIDCVKKESNSEGKSTPEMIKHQEVEFCRKFSEASTEEFINGMLVFLGKDTILDNLSRIRCENAAMQARMRIREKSN